MAPLGAFISKNPQSLPHNFVEVSLISTATDVKIWTHDYEDSLFLSSQRETYSAHEILNPRTQLHSEAAASPTFTYIPDVTPRDTSAGSLETALPSVVPSNATSNSTTLETSSYGFGTYLTVSAIMLSCFVWTLVNLCAGVDKFHKARLESNENQRS